MSIDLLVYAVLGFGDCKKAEPNWEKQMTTRSRWKTNAGAMAVACVLARGALAQSPVTNATPTGQIGATASAVNQLQSTQAEQAELIQKLLGRLEQLEKGKAEEARRTEATEK